jgi:hypothetical protein
MPCSEKGVTSLRDIGGTGGQRSQPGYLAATCGADGGPRKKNKRDWREAHASSCCFLKPAVCCTLVRRTIALKQEQPG